MTEKTAVSILNELVQNKQARWKWEYNEMVRPTKGKPGKWSCRVSCFGHSFVGTGQNKKFGREAAAHKALQKFSGQTSKPVRHAPVEKKIPTGVPANVLLMIDGDNRHREFVRDYVPNVLVLVFVGKTTVLPKESTNWLEKNKNIAMLYRADMAVPNAADMLISVTAGKWIGRVEYMMEEKGHTLAPVEMIIVSADNFGEAMASSINQLSNGIFSASFAGVEIPKKYLK